jgi:ribosomal protein L7/L12
MENLPAETKDAILDAIASNRKIDAVKLYQNATGSSLKTAKEVIETRMGTSSIERTNRLPGEFPGVDSAKTEAILDAIFQGKKLDAVKQYKTASGLGLKESKEFIEDLTQRLKSECPEQFRVADNSGCASVLLVSLMIGSAIVMHLH